jgi:rhodanese-related sulfurtransferase
MLFDSLRNRIMTLPDEVVVYPGHGAGSSCGKSMSSETIGTLGEQKRTNYALRADMSKEEFVREVTEGILPPPQYFPKNAMMNKMGYDSFEDVLTKGTKALDITSFNKEVEDGALILDVRSQEEFVKGHIPNSLFIGLNGTFAMWVGALITDIHQRIVLIAPEGKEEEAVTRLARVGYDNTVGYLKGGVETYIHFGKDLKKIESTDAQKVEALFSDIEIVDVRKPGEFSSEHIENAIHYPLDFMNDDLSKLDKNKSYYVHCAGGYRSVIAISILLRNGYKNLIDISGGFAALKKTDIPRTAYVCPSTLK